MYQKKKIRAEILNTTRIQLKLWRIFHVLAQKSMESHENTICSFVENIESDHNETLEISDDLNFWYLIDDLTFSLAENLISVL